MVTILQRAYSATLANHYNNKLSQPLPSIQTLLSQQPQQQLQTPQSQPQQPKLTKTTLTSSLIRSSCSRIPSHCQRLLTMVLRPTSEKTSSTRCRLWNLRRCVTPLFFTVRAKVASADKHSLVLLTSTTPPTRYWFPTSPHPPPQQDYSQIVEPGHPSPDHSPCPNNPLYHQPLTSFTILSKKNFC